MSDPVVVFLNVTLAPRAGIYTPDPLLHLKRNIWNPDTHVRAGIPPPSENAGAETVARGNVPPPNPPNGV